MLIAASIVSVILAAGAAPASPTAPASPVPISRDSQFIPVDRALQRLNAVPTARSIAAWHELLGSEPHIAGTEGDAREIARIRDAFVAMGLSTTVEEFEAPLPQPSEALVEIVRGTDMPQPAPGGRRGVIALPTVERNLAEDPATAHPGLTFGWNAYSASGDV
ncbi:MAG: hypothetical protein EBU31_17250, partial [Proteobacteria bacterium]|nr:hypothetical protein [Pseudomonadota bacterium]